MDNPEKQTFPNSLHLSDGSIRGAILSSLHALGYRTVPGSLRIYGYGEDSKVQLDGFQGHVDTVPVAEAIKVPIEKDGMYFYGVYSPSKKGHYLYLPGSSSSSREMDIPDDFPVRVGILDGGLLGKEYSKRPQTEGQAVFTNISNWTIVSFWDRSGDPRGNSNANFVMRGRWTFDEAVARAKQAFPTIWKRFTFDVVNAYPY